MKRFSYALSEMNLREFTPQGNAETKQADIETAEEAAIIRLRPIRDSLDFWEDRISPATGSGAPAPDPVRMGSTRRQLKRPHHD
jgi:hypothetical protein